MKFKKNNKRNKSSKVSKNAASEIEVTKINQLKQQMLQYKLEEKYEEAREVISELFTMEYYGTDVMYELAENYYITGDLERAGIWSEKVISFDAKHGNAYLLLAKIYMKNNSVELLPVLNKLMGNDFVSIKDKVEDLLKRLDLTAYKDEIEKKYENLYQYVTNPKEQVVEVKPVEVKSVEKNEQLLNNLKNLLQELGLEKKKETTLSEVISNAFENGLTDQTVEKLKVEEVEKVIDEIIHHAHENDHKVNLLNAVAVKFYEDNCVEKVLPILTKALELDAQDDNSLKNLSVVLFNVGQKDLALEYVSKIANKDIAMVDLIKRIKG